MDRDNHLRAFPMYNPSPNSLPLNSDDQLFINADGRRPNQPSNNNIPYGYGGVAFDDYFYEQFARLAIEQSTHEDILRRLRAESAAQQFPRNRNNYEGLINGPANPPLNDVALRRFSDALNYGRFNDVDAALSYGDRYYSRRLNGGLQRRLNGEALNYFPQQGRSVARVDQIAVSRARQRANLSEMRGRIVSVAKDQYGSRVLQAKFEEGNPEDIHMIFMEFKDHVYELMVHQFGNYLIQKFVEVCNHDQMTQLLFLLINDEHKFAEICADMYGTRAVQKVLENLTTQEQRCRIISVIRRVTVALTKTMNGHHVIQFCLKSFPPEDNQHILNVVADNCLDIAFDKSGCCVLQQCLHYAVGEPRQRLIAELTSNALELSQHPFGNYVVQYILGLKIGHATSDILRQLSGNFVSLCMDKYGSNVVEKCLNEIEEHQKIIIIEEIIYSPNFLRVLQDPFGNYVAQRALETCKGAHLHALIDMINRNAANLHSHPHGKRVLEKTTKANKPSTYM